MLGLGSPVEVVGEELAVGIVEFEFEEVDGGKGGWELDWAEGGGGVGLGRDRVGMLVGEGAVEVVDRDVCGGSGESIGEIVDDLQVAGGFVELDVDQLGGLLDGEERGVGLEVVVVELPDEAGLRGVAHPGDDGGGGMEELRVAALVHGAEGLVVRELRFADEVGEVGDACRSGRR